MQIIDYKKTVRAASGKKNLTIGQQINFIKQNVQAHEYKEALKLLPAYNKYIQKKPFFSTLEDVYIKEPFGFTNDFKKEFKWLCNSIEPHLEQINLFFEQKIKFEKYFLSNDYINAQKVVIEIEEKYGVSLWSIEANLLLNEFSINSEANWNKLSYYLKEIKNSIYEFLISTVSKRIEVKLSHENFINQFQNDLDNTNANGLIKDFFVFKSFPCANYEYEFKNLESVLYVSNIFSVVDQYLTLIDVINNVISKTSEYDKLIYSFIKNAKDTVLNDYRISNIYNVINDKNALIQLDNTSEIIHLSNLYYNGKFEDSLSLANSIILKYPFEFEIYEIYCKSLINLKKDFVPLNICVSVDAILENTYNALLFRNEEAFKALLKTSLLFIHTNIGKQIHGLISELEGYYESNYIVSFLSASFNSYKNHYLIKNRKPVESNFSKFENEHSFKIYRYKNGGDFKDDSPVSDSICQQIIFNSLSLYNKGEYAKAVELLSVDKKLNELSYYKERKFGILYYSYLNLNYFKDALQIFGDVFFNENLVTKKLDYNQLYDKLGKDRHKSNYCSYIEYPILFSLNTKEYDLYEAYDEFMCSCELSNIKDFNIDKAIVDFSLDKVVYFLKNVVTIDTLKYSTDYGSIGEVEEDRILILKKLAQIDTDNKLSHEREIEEIYRVNSIRKVLKEVDEGRLYIDINNLKAIQIKKFNDNFIRYKAIEQSSSSQSLIGFNPSNTKNWDKALLEKTETIDKYNNADYLAFKSIYLESRDNFLFSKEYGLDSCLSTRIRHGALKNHIRSVFEKLDLITSKINNKYKDNEVWSNQLSFYSEQNNSVQGILKEFSKSIDEFTIFIVEKLIQIQTEKTTGKDDGLFTFFTNDELLYKFYNHNKQVFTSIESTIDIILTSLTNRTLIELQINIEKYFSEVILLRFKQIIDDTVGKLRNLNLPKDYQLISALLKSHTEIQIELENISNWFYLNTTNPSTLLEIDTVISASVELMNKINPNYKINPVIEKRCESFAVYSSLIFVFNILFNNVIQHSNLNSEQTNVKVELDKFNDSYFLIKVTNKLNSNLEYTRNAAKLQEVKDNWNDHSKIEKSNKEGESGFDKIKRILLYETFSKTEKFDFTVKKDEMSIHLYFPYTKINKDE